MTKRLEAARHDVWIQPGPEQQVMELLVGKLPSGLNPAGSNRGGAAGPIAR
jgi:hypothetical protein